MAAEKKDQIMQELAKGGLVLVERQMGKSSALIDFAAANPGQYAILVPNLDMLKRLRGMAVERGVNVPISAHPDAFRGRREKVLIEEYFYHRILPDAWHAAVATVPFRIAMLTNMSLVAKVTEIKNELMNCLKAKSLSRELRNAYFSVQILEDELLHAPEFTEQN